MIADPTAPLTAATFDFLPDDNKIYLVYDHGGIVSEQHSPHAFSVLVHFFIVPEGDPNFMRTPRPRTFDTYVPLSDFLYFGLGSWFKRRRHRGRSRLHTRTKFASLKTKAVLDAFVDGTVLEIYSARKPSRKNLTFRGKGQLFLLSGQQTKPIFLNILECIRFYFCGLGHVSDLFLETIIKTDLSKGLWLDSQTGFIDDHTFVIAPAPEAADPATATQLALILANPDLFEVAQATFNYLAKHKKSNVKGVPEFEFPTEGKDLETTFRPSFYTSKGLSLFGFSERGIDGKIVGQILCDNRAANFKNLIILDPRPDYVTDFHSTAELGYKRITSGEWQTLLHPNSRSHSYSPRRSRTELELTEAFPELRCVKVKVERETRKYKPKTPFDEILVSRRNDYPDQSSVLSMKSFSTAKGDWTGGEEPMDQTHKMKRRTIFGGTKFLNGNLQQLFSNSEQQALIQNDVKLESLKDPRCEIFVSAINELRNKNNLNDLIFFSAPLFGISKGAAGFIHEQGQPFVASFFKAHDKCGVVIEISRLHHQAATSIGVIIKNDGTPLDKGNVVDILKHCTKRITLRGKQRKPSQAYVGIWPSQIEFDDVRSAKLNHTKKRKHPYYLATSIHSLIINLLNNGL